MGDMEELKKQLKAAISVFQETTTQNTAIISTLLTENRTLKREIEALRGEVRSKKEDRLEKEIVKKYRKKKKEIIQQKILELINTHTYSLPDLKDIIVDDLGYCSKATFYRYIEDIKNRGLIEIKDKIIASPIII